MEQIIVYEWFKYLGARDIAALAAQNKYFSGIIRPNLAQICKCVYLNSDPDDRAALVRALVEARKNSILIEIWPIFDNPGQVAIWAAEFGNDEIALWAYDHNYANVPQLLEAAIEYGRNVVILTILPDANSDRAKKHFREIATLKFPLFGEFIQDITCDIIDHYVYLAASSGNYHVLAYYSDSYEVTPELFARGCASGDLETIKFMLSRANIDADPNRWILGITNAISSGNMSIARLFRDTLVAPELKFYAAAESRNINIVMLYDVGFHRNNYEHALFHACEEKCWKIINYLLDKRLKRLDYGLDGACRAGDLKLAKYMRELGARITSNTVQYVGHSGHWGLLKFIMDNYEDFDPSDCLMGSALSNARFVRAMIAMGASESAILEKTVRAGNWVGISALIGAGVRPERILGVACYSGDVEVIHDLLELRPNIVDWENIIAIACLRERPVVVNILRKYSGFGCQMHQMACW